MFGMRRPVRYRKNRMHSNEANRTENRIQIMLIIRRGQREAKQEKRHSDELLRYRLTSLFRIHTSSWWAVGMCDFHMWRLSVLFTFVENRAHSAHTTKTTAACHIGDVTSHHIVAIEPSAPKCWSTQIRDGICSRSMTSSRIVIASTTSPMTPNRCFCCCCCCHLHCVTPFRLIAMSIP